MQPRETNSFRTVSEALHVPRNNAARITRAVLHAVRDKIPAEDAIQFAQGLPLALKGVFIDQYDLSRVPLKLRHAGDFLDYIYYKGGQAAEIDFPNEDAIIDALKAVFNVLNYYMEFGQVAQIKRLLGKEVENMIDTYQIFYPD